jgi:hypothetical protein
MKSKDDLSDNKEIQKVIERFFQGVRDLDAKLISSVFHPQSNSFSLTSRGICIEPAETWSNIIQNAKTDENHLFRERFSSNILKIDIAGTAASVKVEWIFESVKIIDFYNLIKTEGKWYIVNRVYHTFH